MEVYDMSPLAGGHGGETFVATSAGERTVVRIYAHRGADRGRDAVDVDAAVLRLVRGLLPVAEVLEVRRPDPALGTPGLLVTSFLPGERLDLVLPALDAARRAVLGTHLGDLLARLARMPTLRGGLFADGDLRLEPMPRETEDLPAWVESHRGAGAFADWPEADLAALLAVADQAQGLLDRLDRTCLVHSDFNPKNVLVDPDSLAVTGLVDWEFAHSGLPVTDLGNLLRFERDPALADAVVERFREQVPDAGRDVLDLARAADLYALVDLAARRGVDPVADRAHAQLAAIVQSGDLHAVAAPG